jgi:hypothetical protein
MISECVSHVTFGFGLERKDSRDFDDVGTGGRLHLLLSDHSSHSSHSHSPCLSHSDFMRVLQLLSFFTRPKRSASLFLERRREATHLRNRYRPPPSTIAQPALASSVCKRKFLDEMSVKFKVNKRMTQEDRNHVYLQILRIVVRLALLKVKANILIAPVDFFLLLLITASRPTVKACRGIYATGQGTHGQVEKG